ncbi:hypothetical protein AX774_g7884 [Zancudomyces culisetae]|uniref:Uncharacterized protein n=1 Tax=Zancudomyces culisetae TaxID=1213189 RepID=A0A1R1PCL2_ZANCU|nr:hypothetical protein AX774_g7884 [Zancudomyces culisetae]|eukprot:OMH78715.1 hypothetical protein AX774_g7884 [Zancudomyces culisetae]
MYLLETQVYGEMEFIDHLLNEMETCIELIIPSRMTNLFSTEAHEDHGKNGDTHVFDSQLQTGEESTADVCSGYGTYGNELDDVLAIMNPNISNEIEIEFNPQHFVSEIKSQFINQVHAETQSQSQGQALVRDQDQDQNQDSFAHGGFELIYNKLREDYKELENRYLKSVNSNIGVYRKCSKRTNKTIHSNNLDYIEAKGSHEGAGDFGNSRLWDTLIKTKSRIDDIMIKCQDLGIGDIIDEYSVENTFGIAVGEDNDDDDEFEDVPMDIPKDIPDANDDLPIDQSPFTGQIDPKHTANTHNVNFLGYPGSNISTNRKAEPGSYNLDDLVTNSINPYTSNPLYSNYDSIDKTRSQKAHPSSSSYFLNFSYQNADNNIDKDTQQLGKSTHKDKYIAPSISTRPHPPEPAHIDEHNDIHGYEPKSKNPRSSSTSEKPEPTAKKQPKKPPKKNSYQVLNKLMKTGNKRRR